MIPTPNEVYGTLLHHRYRQYLNKIALDMKSPEFLQEGKLVVSLSKEDDCLFPLIVQDMKYSGWDVLVGSFGAREHHPDLDNKLVQHDVQLTPDQMFLHDVRCGAHD
jgi:hypothetical protein